MSARVWVKICGTTTFEDAALAVDAGADALGFIFARSPRQVTPAQVARIAAKLPEHIERYGVFVQPSFADVVETVEEAGLTGVQIHATDDWALAARLRAHYSAQAGRKRFGLLQVLHFGSGFNAQLEALQQDHSVDAVLVDSHSASAEGGTGLRFDWAAASGSFLRAAPHLRLIAAGGLAPENVAEAIATLRPWGVDVVTGVEATPGCKDAAKVRSFIERAQKAASALARAPHIRVQ